MNEKMAETETPVRRKRKRGAVAVAPQTPEPPVAEPQGGATTPTVVLEHSLQIKEVEEAQRRLLAALAQGPSMILDMAKLATVDTAGVQLLLAFRIEAAKRGVHVEFRGESAPFAQALAVLGLRDAFAATVP